MKLLEMIQTAMQNRLNLKRNVSKYALMGSYISKMKTAIICISGFVNARDKKQRNARQEQLHFVLVLDIRLKNLMLINTIMLRKQADSHL